MQRLVLSLAVSLLVVTAAWSVTASALLQTSQVPEQKGGVGDITGPYQIPDPKWPAWAHPYPKPGYIWGSQAGVFAESPDRIFLANRGELKVPDNLPRNFTGNWGFFGTQATGQPIANQTNFIVVVDGNGNLIEAWNQWSDLFAWGRGAHAVYINPYDPERHVWLIDDMRHVIFKFTNDGKKLVQTIGKLDEFGDNEDLTRFRRPTAMDWLPDGTFFVSDGYGNSRVVKFDKDGKPLMKWGTRGTGQSQFITAHGIAVGGSPPRVFVSDRSNARIQVFDVNGNFLEEWPGIAPHTLMISADEHLWAVDSRSDRIVKFDLSGRVEYAFGQNGTRPGDIWCGHQMSADTVGNLYIAECFGGRTQKFVPRPGADPRQMVMGRPLMPKQTSQANEARRP
jgi:hypothetical protein